jgi:hypothetical protein
VEIIVGSGPCYKKQDQTGFEFYNQKQNWNQNLFLFFEAMNPKPKPSRLRTGPGPALIYSLEVWVTFQVLICVYYGWACSIEVHVSR